MTPARLWSIKITKILAAIVVLSLFACMGKGRIETALPDPALEARLREASASFGAALSWLEAGDGAKAKELAMKAAEHPSYKAKSEEILKKSAAGSRASVCANKMKPGSRTAPNGCLSG